MILAAPPKPANQMTDAERRAWADTIFDAMAAQRPVVDTAGAYLEAKADQSGESTEPVYRQGRWHCGVCQRVYDTEDDARAHGEQDLTNVSSRLPPPATRN